MIYEMLSGHNPFKAKNKNKFEKLQMIIEDDIEMLPSFSPNAVSLIKGLLDKKVILIANNSYQPKDRLGFNGA